MKRTGTGWLAVLMCSALPVLAHGADDAASQADAQRQLAEAQQRLDAAVREVAELSTRVGRDVTLRIAEAGTTGVALARPPTLIGVGVGVDFDSSTRQEGARVTAVSPGGPAAEAGIRQGDVIVSVAGHDLAAGGTPWRALVERVSQLEPERAVTVVVLREGNRMNFQVTPRAALLAGVRVAQAQGPRGPLSQGELLRQRVEGQRLDIQRVGTPGVVTDTIAGRLLLDLDADPRFRDLEFATLSEGLGSYFGVKSGVLVVRAGKDTPYKLQDGDVILAIDGREVSSAQQAGRILRSYMPGEPLKLRVQRERRARDIEVTVPRDGRG